jgi:hypothetical protein
MSRKVFTAGEVLAAADVNSFLMDQTVMSFPTSAARGSAIPTPTLGMYTHLEDAPARTQFWDGSAWVSPFGATLLRRISFSTQAEILLDGIFTTEFDSYEIYLSFVTSASVANTLLQFRKAGSNITTSTYTTQSIDGQGAGLVASSTTTTNVYIGNVRSSPGRGAHRISILNPANASTQTNYFSNGFDNFGGAVISNGQNTTVDGFDGLKIFPSTGTITGIVSVYGMRI